MNIQHLVTSEHTLTTVDGKPTHSTAPGIIPPHKSAVTGEDALWRVRVTYKGAQKSTSGDGGLQDRQQQAWRGWPSVKHRTRAV